MDSATNANTVTLMPEGYVFVQLVGKQDYMSMDEVAKKCARFADDLRAQGKPVLGLVDFTGDSGFNSGTNKAVMHALESIDYDRAALYGRDKILSEVTKAVVLALGKSQNTKVFANKEEALAWLVMKDPLAG
jgi:hypothetical protein